MKKIAVCIFPTVQIIAAVLMMFVFAACSKKEAKLKITSISLAHIQIGKDSPYAYGANMFKTTLEKESEGKLKAVIYNGTMGQNEPELIEKLETGTLNIGVCSPSFFTAIGIKEADILSLLYLFNSYDHWNKALTGDFGQAIQQLISDKSRNRFRVIGFWTEGVRNFYGKREVKNPSDLRGITISTQTAQTVQDFWQGTGAIPVSIAWKEMNRAFELGVVDSSESDYRNLMLEGHHRLSNSRYISETCHDYTTRLLITSGTFWDALSEQQRNWMLAACKAASAQEFEAAIHAEDEAKAKVLSEGAVITAFADIDTASFKSIALPIQDRFARSNQMENLLQMIRDAER